MKRYAIIAVSISVVMLLLWHADSRIRAEAYLRSASMEALWGLILSYTDEHESPPHSLGDIVRYEKISKEPMKIFKGNLSYRSLGDGRYKLWETNKRMVRLFRSDRLLASDSSRPRWESGKGELAP